MFILEGTRIGLGDFVDDLRYPVWPEKRRAFRAFDIAHFLRHFGAGIQYAQQLGIELVDLHAQGGQGV